jgi:hypothetical protein
MLVREWMINNVGHTKSHGLFIYPCPTPHTKDEEPIVARCDETTNNMKRKYKSTTTIDLYFIFIDVRRLHRTHMLVIKLMINSAGHTKSHGSTSYPCPTPHTKDEKPIAAHNDETTNNTK